MPTNVRFVELRHTIFALAASVLLVATGQAETAQKNWDDKCASCHGANGDGKTKQGVKLHIKDYTEPKVQADFTDSGLLKNLLLGIANENGVERMPGFKDKLTVAEAKDLIALIRTFRK